MVSCETSFTRLCNYLKKPIGMLSINFSNVRFNHAYKVLSVAHPEER